MLRVVSLYLPTWAADRRRRMGALECIQQKWEPVLRPDNRQNKEAPSREKPLVFAGRVGGRHIIVAADQAALALGLRPGLALAEAQARVPDLFVEAADPATDAAALERLAAWALRRYSPIVALDPPDGLFIDITSAAHLFGGEPALLDDLLRRFTAAHIHARAALADTIGAAHALARFAQAPLTIAAPGKTEAALAKLPIAALRLDPELADRLRRLGFETIGGLAAIPRAPLRLRFGEEPLRRLDQAFGRLAEPLQPYFQPELIHVRRAFAEPISAPETLARYTGKLVASLCRALEQKGLGARRLDLLFHRVDKVVQAIRAGLARPTRDATRLTWLLTDRLESIEPGLGIEEMRLAASLAEPLAPSQCDISGPNAKADLADLVDRLANRTGVTKLYRAAPAESDLPERSVRRLAPLAPPAGALWPKHWPRPSRLLSPPEPIDALALLPDRPPAQFTWRGVCRRVKRADGPERVFGEWWRREEETAAVRDYFLVEDESGERFWLFRSGDGEDLATGNLRWYLHGVFA
jgi:protein ImuB